MKRLLPVLLLLAGCASAPPPPPEFKQVPRAVVDAMCIRFQGEGMISELRAVKETQSLITPASLAALGEFVFKPVPLRRDSLQKILTSSPIPLEIPAKTCVARFIEPSEFAKSNDVMVLQFSMPFVSPYTRDQTGVLARLSLGDTASTWYWVPLVNHSGTWFAGTPASLSVLE